MTPGVVLLTIYVALALGYWTWAAWCAFRTLRGVPLLSRLHPPEPGRWPGLSVVVPACNEADHLEAAARTLLAEDYPDLEIILLDDRSTDATGEIVDRLAAEDDRVTAVHIVELPDGWLGKPHAMDRGFRQSTGEFVLFTDADVHFRKGTLRKAISHCLEHGLDHLTAFPDVWPSKILLDSTVAMFVRQNLIVNNRPWSVRNPRSKAFMGIGAFNLVRRAAFEATEGFEWLRLEVADDLGVGLMMKRSGARCDVIAAHGDVGLHWYRTLRETMRGAEKAYAAAHYSILRALAIAPAILGVELAPVLTLLPLLSPRLRPLGYVGLAVSAAFVSSALMLHRWGACRLAPSLLGPLTAPAFVAMFLRACLVGWLRGGITWRGTLYPTEALRRGRRVSFP
jgi:hypothetical protein